MTATTADREAHWQQVWRTKASDAVSWWEASPETSLRLLRDAGLSSASRVIDVGGGDARLVDALLDGGASAITVLDISSAALARAQARLGARAPRVRWLAADVTGDWQDTPVDLWHDRAVFHFLTDPADRARYLEHLRRCVVPGGQVVLATFADDGPERCSGLPAVRYTEAALAAQLGPEFALEDSVRVTHATPTGGQQSFVYVRCRRVDGAAPLPLH